MITKTYQSTITGKLVASGEGVATLSCPSGGQWAVGDSDAVAPTSSVRHSINARDTTSMQLEEGEHLWIFGGQLAAVTAANPAPGDV
jgi:hypothetical protein